MSRFEDTLRRDLRQIADRATPSPDTWHQIQLRIGDQEPNQETEIIMLTDNTFTRRRWPVVAAAAGVVALGITGVALVDLTNGSDVPADVPTSAVAPEPDGIDGNAVDETTIADPEPSATPLQSTGTWTLEPGRYSTDRLGVSIELVLPETALPWQALSLPGALGLRTDDGFIAIGRLGSWYDATEARTDGITGLGSIPPDDIDGWIAANGLDVVRTEEVEVDGRSATFREITIPDAARSESCNDAPPPCIFVGSGSADTIEAEPDPIEIVAGENPTSLWLIELDDFEPIGVFAFAFDGAGDGWSDTAAQVVGSMTVGEPGPSVEGGTARVSTFDATNAPTGLALPDAGGTVEPGRYASTSLGVPIALDLETGETAPWTVVADEPGSLWFTSTGSDQEFIAIGRLGSWYDATEARSDGITGLGSIPPDDIDGWIAQNGIVVVDSDEVEVGGRPAAYRQFRLDTTPGATADSCVTDSPCLWAATGSADVDVGTADPIQVGLDRVQSIWLVDMAEFEPVYIFAAARLGDEGDLQWFADVVQPIVDGIRFGQPAPAVPGGTARLPDRATVTATMMVNQTGERTGDGPWPLARNGLLSGGITGSFEGTGVSSPNGAEVTLDWTMDATIDGLGTGTLTLRSYWFWSGDGATTATDHVIGGTGELAGVTGFGTTVQTSDFPGGAEYTADIELQLAAPSG